MKRIVLIEEEHITRRVLHRIFNAEGYRVYSARNGWDGLQLSIAVVPDIIVCDVDVPVLDGYKVIEEIRRNPLTCAIPFIFLTGKKTRADIREGMDRGADDFIIKPFEPQELLKSIRAQEQKHAALTGKYEKKIAEMEHYISMSLPHELRTPIAGIMGASSLLKNVIESLPPHEIKAMADVIHTYSLRMNRLIDNYMLYAELDLALKEPSGAAAYKKNRVKIMGEFTCSTQILLEESARTLAKKAGREGDLSLELQDSGARIPVSDLKKITEELVENAFNYSAPGTPVHVVSHVRSRSLVLSVKDQGRGMTSEQVSSIDAFQQFDRSFFEQQGAGLGLAITKHLIRLYDGKVSVESVPDKGTVITIAIPL
jgi:two-component system, sensor histidine kinase and response regulator